MSTQPIDEDPNASVPDTWKSPKPEAVHERPPAVQIAPPPAPTNVDWRYPDWSRIYLISSTGPVGPFAAEQVYALYRAGQITLDQLLAPEAKSGGPDQAAVPLKDQLPKIREWAIPESGSELCLTILGIGLVLGAVALGFFGNLWYQATLTGLVALQLFLVRNVIGFIRGRP